jgi:hypothetical protein
MTYKDKFSSEEWSSLTHTPLLIFQAVAGADGKIDKKEKKAFSSALASNNISQPLSAEVLESAKSQFSESETIPDYTLSDIALKLQQVDEALKGNIEQDDSLNFKKTMMALGLHVANSSGGFFGSNLSDDEVNALKKVGSYLNLSVTQLQQSPTVQELADKLK